MFSDMATRPAAEGKASSADAEMAEGAEGGTNSHLN